MAKIEELRARKVELTKELEAVEEQISLLGQGKAVEIRTGKNIRNSPFVKVDPDWESAAVLVYADEALTTLARSADHGGWISAEDAAALKDNGFGHYLVD